MRAGIRALAQNLAEIEIVAEAVDGREALALVGTHQPDVVLMDLVIPLIDGIAATSIIRCELPETEVVVLTNMLESASVTGAIRAGAISYLLKDAQAAELRTAIKAAAAGQVHLSPQASAYLLHEVRAPESPVPLTEREADVLSLLAQGHTNKEIAHALHIAEDTVKSHVRHILAKLGAQSRTQATLAAMRLGLVAHEPKR